MWLWGSRPDRGAAGGAGSEQRLAIGKVVKESVDRHREDCRNRIVATIRSVAADLVENAVMDDRMVANLALLLAKDASDALDRRLAALDEEFGKRLNFRYIGPLPPYSFATVEVSLPSFEAVDRARRVLKPRREGRSCGNQVRLSSTDSASAPRSAATSVPVDEGGATRLTDAYKTLMNYAEALPSRQPATMPLAKPVIASIAARSRAPSW